MISNFTELRDAVISYSKRTDLTQEIEQTFIPLAQVRIGRDLKSAANEGASQFTNSTPPLNLPPDFSKIRNLTYFGARGPVVLEGVTPNTIWPSLRGIQGEGAAGSSPYQYAIQNGQIIVAPAVAGDYELSYYRIPAVTAAAPTDPALTQHPQIFLYATLLELYVWTQDPELRMQAMETYGQDIAITNRAEERARTGVTAGVNVPWG